MQNFAITDFPQRQPAPPRALRVLVVDDDRDLVLSLTTLLRVEEYEARGLHDASDIVSRVREYQPDVVILDISMPGKDGWKAVREIRAGVPARRLVIIAMSGEYTRGEHRTLSQAHGFDFHLMKPCEPDVLLTLLRWVGIQSPFRHS